MQNPPGSKFPPLPDADRNFDDLAPRFARNVYGGRKGELRLAVLARDFAEQLPGLLDRPGLAILDAGGGQGQFGLRLAHGHHLTVCDISGAMLAQARQQAAEAGLADVAFVHGSIQDLAAQPQRRGAHDLVLCHAVLEWVVDQQGLLSDLYRLVKPGGYLSLTFYNRHALVMKNLLRGRSPKILQGEFRPHKGSLTPPRPLEPSQVLAWLEARPWQLLCHSGIRVFSDYQLTPESQRMDPQQLTDLELRLSRQEPYRSLGRYQHLLLRKDQ